MQPDDAGRDAISIRTRLRPGDLGTVVYLHGIIYAKEHGFDGTFEAYVAGPLAAFVRNASSRERIWLAERDGRVVGCVAVVAASPQAAQLRWFLVDPGARGLGLGKRLLREALAFCKENGYKSIVLWTERSLTAAAQLYRSAGFHLVEEKPGRAWGREVVEEKYELALT